MAAALFGIVLKGPAKAGRLLLARRPQCRRHGSVLFEGLQRVGSAAGQPEQCCAAISGGDPCDFLSATKQFIQLKDRHSSAPINLLWVQGVVSAESFVRDEKFGVDLRKEVKKRQVKFKNIGFDAILPDGRSKPIPSEFTVVFGIMRDRYKKSGTLSIPFFSKVSPRAVADRV
ncbi:hypothetical protein ABIB90_001105 [Bradyrhizobium sp. JR4.1]|uniref:DUF6119 family protein n=1 Tax=unclassified Bradyrhizobium TaxID=2631580 RepID=UPI003397A62F